MEAYKDKLKPALSAGNLDRLKQTDSPFRS
jgi:hypothetical protein